LLDLIDIQLSMAEARRALSSHAFRQGFHDTLDSLIVRSIEYQQALARPGHCRGRTPRRSGPVQGHERDGFARSVRALT
jgi:hypothetical protein